MARKGETRYQKARRFLEDGCVRRIDARHGFCQGIVQGDHGLYWALVFDDGEFYCECEYGRYHNGSMGRCSHALALALALEER